MKQIFCYNLFIRKRPQVLFVVGEDELSVMMIQIDITHKDIT